MKSYSEDRSSVRFSAIAKLQYLEFPPFDISDSTESQNWHSTMISINIAASCRSADRIHSRNVSDFGSVNKDVHKLLHNPCSFLSIT